MSYAKGYVPDAPHRRLQQNSRGLLGNSPIVPTNFSLESYEHPILDQNRTSACTGHGTAQLLWVTAHGTLPFFPSPKGIYAVTRCLERPFLGEGLTDGGCMPSDVMVAISNWGIRPMSAPSPLGFYTDVDTSNVGDEPKLEELEQDGTALVVGEYRIDNGASDFPTQVCAAISQGISVGIGVFVDTAFENWSLDQGPLTTVNLGDPNGGGHWIGITSYVTHADGKRVFRGPNSWGPGWGDGGHFEVTEDWLRVACSDCYAMNVRAP